jgi:XTP/dITP diphosphohydrolase
MRITFVTQNMHKYEEAKAVLGKHGIELIQHSVSYVEDKEKTIQEVAKEAAMLFAEKLGKPVMVEDTGIFFTAYENFPGPHPKMMFNCLGYEGLLKLLAGMPREAYFLACVGYCEPGKEPQLFEGRLNGRISMMPFNMEEDVMPYERIFVPEGFVHTVSSLSREKKNEISHRSEAIEKLVAWLKSCNAEEGHHGK